jgi:hypothetical protein
MPFSWVRVPTHTSRKIRECTAGNETKTKFEECVVDIVAGDGGSVVGDQIWFEPNGRFAHVYISWDTPDQKRKIVLDLDAADVVDLYSSAEMEQKDAEAYTPYRPES